MPGQVITSVNVVITVVILLVQAGCGARPTITAGPDVVLVVPGVSGDSGRYNGLIRSLLASSDCSIQIFGWGAPAPLFFMNFSTESIHDRAESELAERIGDWHAANPGARIDLIGHSAGCGVILGALPRVEKSSRVHDVILIAPSVSPRYGLVPALERIEGRMYVFVSDRDTLFLKWRTGNFGTYDRIKTPAAGNVGFELSDLPVDRADRVVQFRYDPGWSTLGNDGGHFGALSEAFAAQIIIPLLHTSQSCAANSR